MPPQSGWQGAQRMSAGQPTPLEELQAMRPDPFNVSDPSALDSPLKKAMQAIARLLGAGGDPNLMPLGMVGGLKPEGGQIGAAVGALSPELASTVRMMKRRGIETGAQAAERFGGRPTATLEEWVSGLNSADLGQVIGIMMSQHRQ